MMADIKYTYTLEFHTPLGQNVLQFVHKSLVDKAKAGQEPSAILPTILDRARMVTGRDRLFVAQSRHLAATQRS